MTAPSVQPYARKQTQFQLCERHQWLAGETRERRAEFFGESGPTDGPCFGVPGPCKIRPGTDIFSADVCGQRDWYDTTQGDHSFLWTVNERVREPKMPEVTTEQLLAKVVEAELEELVCPFCSSAKLVISATPVVTLEMPRDGSKPPAILELPIESGPSIYCGSTTCGRVVVNIVTEEVRNYYAAALKEREIIIS